MSSELGADFLISIKDIFDEAAASGHGDKYKFMMVKVSIIQFLNGCRGKTRASARAANPIKFPDGSHPKSTLQLPPSCLSIDEKMRKRLTSASSPALFIKALQSALKAKAGRSIKRPHNVATGNRIRHQKRRKTILDSEDSDADLSYKPSVPKNAGPKISSAIIQRSMLVEAIDGGVAQNVEDKKPELVQPTQMAVDRKEPAPPVVAQSAAVGKPDLTMANTKEEASESAAPMIRREVCEPQSTPLSSPEPTSFFSYGHFAAPEALENRAKHVFFDDVHKPSNGARSHSLVAFSPSAPERRQREAVSVPIDLSSFGYSDETLISPYADQVYHGSGQLKHRPFFPTASLKGSAGLPDVAGRGEEVGSDVPIQREAQVYVGFDQEMEQISRNIDDLHSSHADRLGSDLTILKEARNPANPEQEMKQTSPSLDGYSSGYPKSSDEGSSLESNDSPPRLADDSLIESIETPDTDQRYPSGRRVILRTKQSREPPWDTPPTMASTIDKIETMSGTVFLANKIQLVESLRMLDAGNPCDGNDDSDENGYEGEPLSSDVVDTPLKRFHASLILNTDLISKIPARKWASYRSKLTKVFASPQAAEMDYETRLQKLGRIVYVAEENNIVITHDCDRLEAAARLCVLLAAGTGDPNEEDSQVQETVWLDGKLTMIRWLKRQFETSERVVKVELADD